MSINLCNTFLHKNTPPPQLSMKQQQQQVTNNNKVPKWTCRKKDIHPEFHYDSKVYCSGEHVLTTGGTKKEYVVDVWSGNHPFYLGSRSANLIDADQVEKFRKKFGGLGGLDQLMQIPTLKGEIVIPPKRKPSGKGKKK
nr:50S ribosomal protein L31, chloroplastic [Tanacetum cinerariifolium]